MQTQAQQKSGVSEETTLAFKRHILQKSSGFASEPEVDLFRVNLLAQMFDRYDELREKGMSDVSSQSRVLYEFDDIAARMRRQGLAEIEVPEEAPRNARWPLLSEAESMQYIQERSAYLHRQAMGTALCSSCVLPLMIGAALSEFWGIDAYSLIGLVGMFAMIGTGVYAMSTAEKPKKQMTVKKGKFSLSARTRGRLEQMREDVERKARSRKGKGIVMLVTCVVPILIGAALSGFWGSNGWPVLGVAGMFTMIGAGVYELVMADGENKTMKHLLCEEDDEDDRHDRRERRR